MPGAAARAGQAWTERGDQSQAMVRLSQAHALYQQLGAAEGMARALQYAFRCHYDTTPTGYLRRVRLERAHRHGPAADPATGATVREIARRWGWASPANFAAAYRKHFGVSPSHTLRT